jgi:hypothetical protein
VKVDAPPGRVALVKAELVDCSVEELPEGDQRVVVRALRQRQSVRAAESVEERRILPHVVGER